MADTLAAHGAEQKLTHAPFVLSTGPLEEMSKKDLIQLCRNLEDTIQQKEEEIERVNKHMEYILGLYYETEGQLVNKRNEVLAYKAKELAASLLGPGTDSTKYEVSTKPQQSQRQNAGAQNGHLNDGAAQGGAQGGAQGPGSSLRSYDNETGGEKGVDRDAEHRSDTSLSSDDEEEDGEDESSSDSHNCEDNSSSSSETSDEEDTKHSLQDEEKKTAAQPFRYPSTDIGNSKSKLSEKPVNEISAIGVSPSKTGNERGAGEADMKYGGSAVSDNNHSGPEPQIKPLQEKTTASQSSDTTRIPVAIERCKSPGLSKRSQRRQAKASGSVSKSAQPVLRKKALGEPCAQSLPASKPSINGAVAFWVDGKPVAVPSDDSPPQPKPRARPRTSRSRRPRTARGPPEEQVSEDPKLLRHSVSYPLSREPTQATDMVWTNISSDVIMEVRSPSPSSEQRSANQSSEAPLMVSGSSAPLTTRSTPHSLNTGLSPVTGSHSLVMHSHTGIGQMSPASSHSQEAHGTSTSRESPRLYSTTSHEQSSVMCSPLPNRQSPGPVLHSPPQSRRQTPGPVVHSPPQSRRQTPGPVVHSPPQSRRQTPGPVVHSPPQSRRQTPGPVVHPPPPTQGPIPVPVCSPSQSPEVRTRPPRRLTTPRMPPRESTVIGSMMPDSLDAEESDGAVMDDDDSELEIEVHDSPTPEAMGQQKRHQRGSVMVSSTLDSLLHKLSAQESLTVQNKE